MSVAKIGLLFGPSCSSHEVIAVNNVQLIHLISTFRVEACLVEINCSFTKLVLRNGRSVNNHDDIVDNLQVTNFIGVRAVRSPGKGFEADE